MLRYLWLSMLGYRRTFHAAGVQFPSPVWSRRTRRGWRIIAG